jgi:hypothetical protein
MPAAVVIMGILGVMLSVCAAAGEPTAGGWDVYRVHPWIEAYADQVSDRLVEPAADLLLAGPRNDWLTGALALSAASDTTVTVELEAPPGIGDRLQLRVAGVVRENEAERTVYDPLIAPQDIPDHCKKSLNFQQIKDFPRLHLVPGAPVILWLTVDLRGVASGRYQGSIAFGADAGLRRVVPLVVTVLHAELPVESPLYGIAWNWANTERLQKDFAEHGINVAWRDHESAWKNGARFLLFQFSASFHGKPIDDRKRAEVRQELATVWALVTKLQVPADQWAINLADEPSDNSADIIRQYGDLVKSLEPRTPIWLNPAWVKKPGSDRNVTTTAGTLQRIAPITDIWCPYAAHLWDGSGALEFMKSTQKPLWFYEIWGNASRRPAVGREALRTGPWMAWKYGLQGFGIFSANDWSVDPWVGKVGSQLNYSFTYPSSTGFMSSRGMEALRQGVQEYKRLYVLSQRGVGRADLDAFAGAVLRAERAEAIDAVRQDLDALLVKLTAEAGAARQ